MTHFSTTTAPAAPTTHHHPRLRAVLRRVSMTLVLACVVPGGLFYSTLLVAGVWAVTAP